VLVHRGGALTSGAEQPDGSYDFSGVFAPVAVVVAGRHCCVEYRNDPTDAQVAAVEALLAAPDVDLVRGHHAHVVQPLERIAREWAAYGLGNHVAEHATRGHPTEDAVAARFTVSRGDDGRFRVSRAEAAPFTIDLGADRVTVRPADAETFDRVSEVLGRRGGVAAGLSVVPH
jgi:capsule synthesis protein PGA_cap